MNAAAMDGVWLSLNGQSACAAVFAEAAIQNALTAMGRRIAASATAAGFAIAIAVAV
ncbi:hypothetical protein [Acidihalobacter ferrooxydans]|uniref:hypothetical protein n=1 Tax=Acidihalobacter ferrooxydans TaxID=1765967 RepID=UPI0012EBF40D|nr:hypothetical protein [Acidihalobacter ferrooxydans]